MINKFISIIAAAFIIFAPISAQARYCGWFMGKQINTYGGLSCAKAKKVYQSFNAGHIPQDWTCGQSVGGCGKGKQGFMFKKQK